MFRILKQRYASLGADGLVALWLGVWLVCNLLQACFTELANDEAYYHMFAQNLAWGYFDHPPMTALLVWLGEHIFCGEFGVRVFFVALQPFYLWIVWRLIRPADADRRDGALYAMLAASTLLLQLYGFIAVPDGPLMMSVALFLVTFKWFAERRAWSWLWMGAAMALMAYSKYHGALVVLFAFAANPRLFLRPALYLSGAVAALLLIPHLSWQYDHDWVSFMYHLSDRSRSFEPRNLVEYLLNIFVVFNPLLFPLYIKAWFAARPATAVGRALKFMPAAFFIFFLASVSRNHVQPQWLIVATYGLLYVLFVYARRHPRTRRYVMTAGWVTLALVAVVRFVMIFNPTGIRYEVFNNHESYDAIAAAAEGRPVIFRGSYAIAAKYMFYTGGEAFCEPNIRYRTHQWQFRDDDLQFTGREVIVECPPAVADSAHTVHSIKLANGRDFSWFVDEDFRPVRLVDIYIKGLPERVRAGEELRMTVTLCNPYEYDIEVGEEVSLEMLWKHGRFRIEEYDTGARFTLPGWGSEPWAVVFEVPAELAGSDFDAGFALVRKGYVNWFNGKPLRVEVAKQ